MQRDFDLVVTILGALRDADATSLSAQDIKTAVAEDNESLELICHHMDLLADAGLVKHVEISGNWRITWKGYDALEQDEDDEDDMDDEE